MRMKSNAMFWLEINAEGMLLLRSYLKAGRFDVGGAQEARKFGENRGSPPNFFTN
jgi:hypothetical protein